jgi:pantoate--beta-alanine ligase
MPSSSAYSSTCFEPNATAIYPDGFQTQVTVPGIAKRWEGEFRPHHFGGVATVVAKLFGMVRPHLALFGQKDFQQAALVCQLAKDLNLGVAVQVHPTVRERDGLAMSSRNIYLPAENRLVAQVFYQALQAGRQAIERGEKDGESVQEIMRAVIAKEPAIHIDYLAVCDPSTLEPLTSIERQAVLLGAIRIGSVRLIDNVLVKLNRQKGRRQPAR